ncbi:MAG: PQQ-binding-like beta-propeller repeat protein [Acidimicrobiales bacterium]
MRTTFVYRLALLVTCVVASMLVPSVSGAAGTPASWPFANGNLSNTRVAGSSTISLTNVSKMRELWAFSLTGKATSNVGGYGTLAANPIVQNGVVYMQDLHSNVYALSLATGHLEWEYRVNLPELSGPGPNGVAVAGGMVYGESPHVAFALNATNGHLLWSDKKLLRKNQGTFGIQPQVANGQVFFGSQYGSAKGGGILISVSAATGHVLWKFNTMTGPEPGPQALGVGAGGVWETPLVSANGTVSFGIGNPYQSVGEAFSQPAKLLYSDSDVTLDAATGKLRWYYQAVPNDFKDYDMQASPIAATLHGVPVVIGGGKMGYVYEMNATTGALLWKTPVGIHNGYDNQSLDALNHTATLKLPFTFLPGAFGGILSDMAYADNTIYAATMNLPIAFTTSSEVDGGSPKGKSSYGGDIVALNATTGAIEWSTKVDGLPDGATTVSNNLVFAPLLEGQLVALNRTTGAIVYSQKLPRVVNSPIAIAGNTIIVPVGGPKSKTLAGKSQIIAYAVPSS